MFNATLINRSASATRVVFVIAMASIALAAAVFAAVTTGDITPIIEAGRRMP